MILLSSPTNSAKGRERPARRQRAHTRPHSQSVIKPDPIPFLESLGYTRREAAFLYAVGMHSGYFLRRQFDACIGRVKGAISQHFLSKALRRGHIRALDFGVAGS